MECYLGEMAIPQLKPDPTFFPLFYIIIFISRRQQGALRVALLLEDSLLWVRSRLARCQTIGPGRDNSRRYVYRNELSVFLDPEGADCIVPAVQ